MLAFGNLQRPYIVILAAVFGLAFILVALATDSSKGKGCLAKFLLNAIIHIVALLLSFVASRPPLVTSALTIRVRAGK